MGELEDGAAAARSTTGVIKVTRPHLNAKGLIGEALDDVVLIFCCCNRV
jgi:hypothetical protein